MSSLGLSGPLNLLLAFVLVLVLIGVIAWAVRRIAKERLGSAARTRQPRLAVLDTAVVDARRQLVIIRRDNIEHLLMIGGGSDLVIETNIVRAAAANTARISGALDAPRTSPVYEGASWPAPQPEMNVRLQRSYPLDEPTPWPNAPQPEFPSRTDRLPGLEQTASSPQPVRQDPPLRSPRSASPDPQTFPSPSREPPPIQPNTGPGPGLMPQRATPLERPAAFAAGPDAGGTPATRPEAAPPLANVVAHLAGRLDAPQRPAAPELQSPGAAFTRTPVQSAASAEERTVSPPPPSNDAATSAEDSRAQAAPAPRFSFPNLKFDRTAPSRTASPPPKTERQTAPPPSAAPPERAPVKPKSRTLYESLEQEMASLLGKPPGKS